MSIRIAVFRFFIALGILVLLCVVAVGGYATWYTYNRAQIIHRDMTCANLMRAPDGQMVCVQELIPPTFIEKVFNLPPHVPEDILRAIPSVPSELHVTMAHGTTSLDGPVPTVPTEMIERLRAGLPSSEPSPKIDILTATMTRPYLVPLMEQAGKIDEHVSINTVLAEVTVCGTDFVARTLTYDGIDVVKTLAAMLPATTTIPSAPTSTLQEALCFNIAYGNAGGGLYPRDTYRIAELPVFDVQRYSDTTSGHTKYIFSITQQRFELDGTTGNLYVLSGYDGSPSLVGNVKR